MGKCCSKAPKEERYEEEVQEVLLDVDPGGGGDGKMTGGTLVVRSPGRWQVTTTRDIPVTTTNRVITTRPKNGNGTSATVTKTFRIGNNGSGSQTITTFNGGSGNSGLVTRKTTNVTKGFGDGSPTLLNKSSGQGFPSWGSSSPNGSSSIFNKSTSRMGKTITETATRVYYKDGKRFEEIVETVTNEASDGSITKTTKTTTRECSSEDSHLDGAKSKPVKGGAAPKSPTAGKAAPQDNKAAKPAPKKDGGPKSPPGGKGATGRSPPKPSTTTKSGPNKDTKPAAKPGVKSPTSGAKTVTSKERSRKSSQSGSDSSPERKGTKQKSGRVNVKSKTTSSSTDSDSDDDDFVADVYVTINKYRKNHGVNELKLSPEMNRYAKEWAKSLAAKGKMHHRPDNTYGENVYCMSSSSSSFKIKGQEVVDKWYNEIRLHEFGKEPKNTLLKSGHFTQLIWKDTQRFGVGKAKSADRKQVFVVANFDPKGNWLGQFADQVPPVGGFPKGKGVSAKVFNFGKSSTSTSTSSSSDSSDEGDFNEECLEAHNNYRKKHGVPPLKLNKELSKFALQWAKKIASMDVMQHRDNNEYGENLYCAWSSNPKHKIKGNEAVDSWYSEIKDYRFGGEPSDLAAGHFTQVVWKDSRELGVGVARSSSGKIFVVANYDPAGNFVGRFSSQVPSPKF